MYWFNWLCYAKRRRTKVGRYSIISNIDLSTCLHRFADWIFERVHEVRKNDVQKQLLVNAFRHSIRNESEMLCLTDRIQHISEQLKKILESVGYAPLMIAITDTIIDLSRIYPQIFQNIFVVCSQ